MDRALNPLIDNGFEYDVAVEEIRFERGIAWCHIDSLQRGFRDFSFALEKKYSVAECHYWRGSIYIAYNKMDLASTEFKLAAKLGDKDAMEALKTYCK